MLHIKQVQQSLELKAKLPMLLEMDSKGTVDSANNWSVGAWTRNIYDKQYFLNELKEESLLWA